jgi:aspartate/methionine/tyrosine aminotransferase
LAATQPLLKVSTAKTDKRCKVSGRARIDPFIVMDVLASANARAAAGADVIHMEVGEPAGGPPRRVLEVARRAVCHRPLGYTEALGRPALRRAIADHYGRTQAIEVDPDRIAVTVGASGAFVLAFLAAFDPGDRVVVPEPAFPAYRNILTALGVEVVGLQLDGSNGYRPTIAALEALPEPVHGLIIASPSNPTGTMLEPAELEAIAGFCRARGIRLISDEIYHGITYDRPARTVIDMAPDAIVINGFSKYFCMTGWRLGWMVMPADLLRPIERLAQNLFISAPALAQEAALTAFDCGAELDLRIDAYRRNRTALLERLPAAGLERFAPVDGAFYLYVDVSHLTDDSADLCARVLEDPGVALAPGADFDRAAGQRHVRFAFCGPQERMVEGADRLAAWLRRRG